MKEGFKIMIAAGGSGGHIFPAIAFGKALTKQYQRLSLKFVTGHRVMERICFEQVPEENLVHISVRPSAGMKSLVSPSFVYGSIKGLLESISLVRRFKPDLVVGFGGYICAPVVIAAKIFGVKTLIHEQNRTLGRANRVMIPFVDRVAGAFEIQKLNALSKKYRHVGMPLPDGVESMPKSEALQKLRLDPNRKTLVIIGGSQGAESLNKAMRELLVRYASALVSEWQFIHLSGDKSGASLKKDYENSGVTYRLFTFSREMALIYACADLVLCRAGAMTLHELALYQRCPILVPYPSANGHQHANARVLQDAKSAFLIEDQELSGEKIYEILKMTYHEPVLVRQMAEGLSRTLKLDGTSSLIKECEELVGSR